MQERTSLEDALSGIGKVERDLQDNIDMIALGEEEDDAGVVTEAENALKELKKEVARRELQLTGNPTPPDVKPARDWDRSGMRYGSTEKSKRELGFEARTTVRDGLAKTIDWTRNNETLIARCIARHEHHLNPTRI